MEDDEIFMIYCTENVEKLKYNKTSKLIKNIFSPYLKFQNIACWFISDATEIVDESVKITYKGEQNYIKD